MQTTTQAPAKTILRDPPVRTPASERQAKSAALVRELRTRAEGFMSPADARRLMRQAADEIERLQQLPLL